MHTLAGIPARSRVRRVRSNRIDRGAEYARCIQHGVGELSSCCQKRPAAYSGWIQQRATGRPTDLLPVETFLAQWLNANYC